MFIRTETDQIINSDYVTRFEISKHHADWKYKAADIHEIYAHVVNESTESRALIAMYSSLDEAETMLDKIFICLDSGRSLDFLKDKREKSKDQRSSDQIGDTISRETVTKFIQSFIHEIITESGTDKNLHTNEVLRKIIQGLEGFSSSEGDKVPIVTNEQKFKEDWGCEPKSIDFFYLCPSYFGIEECTSPFSCSFNSPFCEVCKEKFWKSEYKPPKTDKEGVSE